MFQQHADVSKLAQSSELSFAAHNRSSYALREEVTLHLDTKNVGPQVQKRHGQPPVHTLSLPQSHHVFYCRKARGVKKGCVLDSGAQHVEMLYVWQQEGCTLPVAWATHHMGAG